MTASSRGAGGTADALDGGAADDAPGMSMGEMAAALRSHLLLLILAPLVVGAAALAATFLIAPTFTASTVFMAPQPAQSGAASALASLGALGGLAGNAAGVTNSADRFVALLQSANVNDRIIDQFKLMTAYEAKFRIDARRELASNVRVSLGKKDGLITVEVDDTNPQRAADIANRYVDELRRITGTLAVSEAQQRRVFFERHLQEGRDNLATAQQALEGSGFNASALKAEPKAAAEAYARLKAEATSAEIRLGLLRSALADSTPEVQQQQAALSALRQQLSSAERATSPSSSSDYISRYREYKYQETLFDVYARQFELARADESRDGALIQVVDPATPPEKKSRPKRAAAAVGAALAAAVLLAILVLARASARRSSVPPPAAEPALQQPPRRPATS